jgi:hypothetical protein
MSEADLTLIKEGLQLLDDALSRFDSIANNTTAHVLAKLVHGVLVSGELLLG